MASLGATGSVLFPYSVPRCESFKRALGPVGSRSKSRLCPPSGARQNGGSASRWNRRHRLATRVDRASLLVRLPARRRSSRLLQPKRRGHPALARLRGHRSRLLRGCWCRRSVKRIGDAPLLRSRMVRYQRGAEPRVRRIACRARTRRESPRHGRRIQGFIPFFLTYPDLGMSTVDPATHALVSERIERVEEITVPQRRLDSILREHAAGRTIQF